MALAAISCVLTGAHAVADVAAGFVAYLAVIRAGAIWESIRRWSERIANSWREWRLGPVRVISHGTYAGVGGAVGLWIACWLGGAGNETAILLAAAAGLIGAGLWAQFIEGSPRLLRPFGYYGGLLGVVLGALAAPLAGSTVWLVLAVYSVAGPWIQSFGRLCCLVQGCCHGRPAAPETGIEYAHPRSRVCRLAELGGTPLHATPLYSILWNVPVAMATGRLWSLHTPMHVIGGVCLILSGLGRFVEEAYRGEPQTPIVGGLRLYQWLAIGSVVAGALVTALGHSAPAAGAGGSTWLTWSGGAVFGVLFWFALGVDFPDSDRRFARLV